MNPEGGFMRVTFGQGPLPHRSFGIKDLGAVNARSLRNKDLRVKYFRLIDLENDFRAILGFIRKMSDTSHESWHANRSLTGV